MKKTTLAYMFTAALLTPLAQADSDGLYTELDILYFTSVGDFDSEQTFGITLGYAFNDRHALEFEFQAHGLDSRDLGYQADADLLTYLAGYRYTFYSSGNLDYFAGAGFGYSNPEFNVSATQRVNDQMIIPFARLGANYRLSDSIYLAGELRYQSFEHLEFEQTRLETGGAAVAGISLGYRF